MDSVIGGNGSDELSFFKIKNQHAGEMNHKIDSKDKVCISKS